MGGKQAAPQRLQRAHLGGGGGPGAGGVQRQLAAVGGQVADRADDALQQALGEHQAEHQREQATDDDATQRQQPAGLEMRQRFADHQHPAVSGVQFLEREQHFLAFLGAGAEVAVVAALDLHLLPVRDPLPGPALRIARTRGDAAAAVDQGHQQRLLVGGGRQQVDQVVGRLQQGRAPAIGGGRAAVEQLCRLAAGRQQHVRQRARAALGLPAQVVGQGSGGRVEPQQPAAVGQARGAVRVTGGQLAEQRQLGLAVGDALVDRKGQCGGRALQALQADLAVVQPGPDGGHHAQHQHRHERDRHQPQQVGVQAGVRHLGGGRWSARDWRHRCFPCGRRGHAVGVSAGSGRRWRIFRPAEDSQPACGRR